MRHLMPPSPPVLLGANIGYAGGDGGRMPGTSPLRRPSGRAGTDGGGGGGGDGTDSDGATPGSQSE